MPLDEASLQPRRFKINVDETLAQLLAREDSDQNYQITIEDKGPKVRYKPLSSYLYIYTQYG